MTRVGTVEVQKTDGSWIEIDVYEPGTFSEEPIEVQLSDGSWAVPFVREDADTPLEVQQTDGSWIGINSVGQILIEDYEYSNTTFQNNYSIVGGTGDIGVQFSNHPVDGQNVAYIRDGFRAAWSLPAHGFLNYYPRPGDRFVFHLRMQTIQDSIQPWFLFGGTSDDTSQVGNNDFYEVNFIENDGAGDWTFRLRARDGTNGAQTVADDDFNDPVLVEDQWYGCLVDWYDATLDGRTGVRLRLYDTTMPDPDTDSTLPGGDIDTADYANSEDGSSLVPQEPGRVGIRCSTANHYIQWDRVITYPPRNQ